jgi:hypothetical protein
LFNVADVTAWCPRCADAKEGQRAPNLDLYLGLLKEAYLAAVAARAPRSVDSAQRRLLGSAYLGAVVPDSAEVHNLLGIAAMRDGRVEAATREFEQAIRKDPGSRTRAQTSDRSATNREPSYSSPDGTRMPLRS